MCKTELHDIHGCSRVFTGVVESPFPVVKSCALAGEKQWFGVFGVLEGVANVHAHLPFVFVFVLCVLKTVHFSWGFITFSALTPLRGCVARACHRSRGGKTQHRQPMSGRHEVADPSFSPARIVFPKRQRKREKHDEVKRQLEVVQKNNNHEGASGQDTL